MGRATESDPRRHERWHGPVTRADDVRGPPSAPHALPWGGRPPADALARSPAAADAGKLVLSQACETAATWRSERLAALRASVDLFPIQFHSRRLVADVEAGLGCSGPPADGLELEITENIALGHGDETIGMLLALRAMGVGLAFDDFGTGYASLSSLMRYPLTRLKIESSFVRRTTAASTRRETAIVESTITMAPNIGLEVVAEGVETEARADFLRSRGCEEAQGYLFARPLPAEEFAAFARARTIAPPTLAPRRPPSLRSAPGLRGGWRHGGETAARVPRRGAPR